MEVNGMPFLVLPVEPLSVFHEAGDFGRPELKSSSRRFETRQLAVSLQLSSVLGMPIGSSQSPSSGDGFLREWRLVEMHWHAEIRAASLQSTLP